MDILRDPLSPVSIGRIIAMLICLPIHELSHGFVAYKMGDNTAKEAGRLTFNPFKHLDIFGTLMILVVGFGWAKAVPVNAFNFENPKKGMAITALAGPISNILLAAIFFVLLVILSIVGINEYIFLVLLVIIITNINLAVFNILPIPPLDGSKALFSILPEEQYFTILKYDRFSMLLVLALLSFGLFDGWFALCQNAVIHLYSSIVGLFVN